MLSTNIFRNGDRIAHAFFTREGGASKGIYSSLNCNLASNDDTKTVAENRVQALASLEMETIRLCTATQVHGKNVAITKEPFAIPPKADGLVTKEIGLALGILTADCAPVLIADQNALVVGAAHCGWKGTMNGVLEATLNAMVCLGARSEDLKAVIGPCIGPESYEVSLGFKKEFVESDPASALYFRENSRKAITLDLPGYIEHRLLRAGTSVVEKLDRDTYLEEEQFFSYRRATHRGESDYGCQLSIIALTPTP